MSHNVKVTYGFAAIRVGRYWAGLTALGYTKKLRRTSIKALKDAESKWKLEQP